MYTIKEDETEKNQIKYQKVNFIALLLNKIRTDLHFPL